MRSILAAGAIFCVRAKAKTMFKLFAGRSAMIVQVLLKYSRPLIVLLHAALIASTQYLAFWLRFDGAIPRDALALLLRMLPWLVVIRGITFVPFRLYEGLWRYTGMWDLGHIVAGVLTSTFIFYILTHWGFGLQDYPRSVFLLDSMLLIFLIGGIRLIYRIYQRLGRGRAEKQVLIYGAGDAGKMVVRDMKYNGALYDYEPVGFIDDDRAEVGHRIHGVQVLGQRKDLAKIIAITNPHEVLVTTPRAGPATILEVVKAWSPLKYRSKRSLIIQTA
jgi:FlaA1/EpsC-like NDP-sugar epimerase